MQNCNNLNWDDIRLFLAVARAGTVSSAAEKLAVNQSTVSRRINAYENNLNVRLFERFNTGYVLTREGEELLKHAERMEEESFAIERGIMGKNVALNGSIRVTAPLILVKYILMPAFIEFTKTHPDIELNIDVSNNLYNLTQREADVAIRVTRDAPPDNLVGRELGNVELGVYGEKKYLKKYYQHKKKDKNTQLHYIGEDNLHPHPHWLNENTFPLKLRMRTNDVLVTLDAVKAGLGVGRLATFIGDAEYNLQKVTNLPEIPLVPMWILSHPDMRQVSRINTFTRFMSEKIRPYLSRMK
jgi:DNA-binding transcriptional LysR family regulator